MNDALMVSTITHPASSFGVSHTRFASASLPDLMPMMHESFITTNLATGMGIKLYRFHYNLLAAGLVDYWVMTLIALAKITAIQVFKLFGLLNKMNGILA